MSPITITFFKQTANIPYTSQMYMDYDLTYENFLRWSGNARTDHPTNRPWEVYTFGDRNEYSAAEDVLDQYLHRQINGYSQWDWDWMLNEYGQWALGNITKRAYGAPMNGRFTAIDASQYNITAGPAVPLDSISKHDQPSDRIHRNADNGEATLVNVESYDWENRVTNVNLMVEGALQQSM